MIKKNKKGIGLMWYMLLVAFFIGLMTFFVYHFSGQRIMENFIGDYQFSILKTVQKSEKAIFYIDQSVRYSLSQAVYELASNGGISEIEVSDAEEFAGFECGKFNDAYVWYTVKKQDGNFVVKKCLDENAPETSLRYLFNQKLNQYLLNYPNNLPIDNYNYEFRNNLEIIGNAVYPIKIDIFRKEIQENFAAYKGIQPSAMDTKQILKDIPASEGFRDFTGTGLCAKGSRCILKEEAFQQLLKAQDIASKKGAALEVYSGYRSLEQQKALWDGTTPENYADRYKDPAVRIKYVCDPKGGEAKCPHMSGKAVDIRLKGKTTSTMSSADWSNIYSIMTSKDSSNKPLWVKYSPEPWHFECCGTPRYERAIAQGATSII